MFIVQATAYFFHILIKVEFLGKTSLNVDLKADLFMDQNLRFKSVIN
jgi:hypothetical protein